MLGPCKAVLDPRTQSILFFMLQGQLMEVPLLILLLRLVVWRSLNFYWIQEHLSQG